MHDILWCHCGEVGEYDERIFAQMSSLNPTTKTSEAMQMALQQASANGNPDIRPAHLLVAILEQADGAAGPVLTAAGVDTKTVIKEAQQLVDGYPKASGSNLANPNFNREALNALTASQELAGEIGRASCRERV